MTRLRPWCALVALILPSALRADEPQEKWLVDRALTITPAAAPVPILKYRFYPTFTERKAGNAVPIYERLAHERPDARKKELQEKPAEWNKLPLDQLPKAEVKKLLDSYAYNFKQLELGARRKTADWNYTLDTGDLIGVLLPDMQEMRTQAGLLALKARYEIAEGRYADAVHTLETGFAVSEHVSPNHFLVGTLVAIACANQMTDAVLELIDRPDAPNLYWALTVLPRPFIGWRLPMDTEAALPEMQFPELADLDRPRTPDQWEADLARLRKRYDRLDEKNPPKPGTRSGDPAAQSPDLATARKYLIEVVRLADVDKMPPAQVLMLYLSHYYHELRDDMFKGTYLPFAQGQPLSLAADERLKNSVHDTEAGRLARSLLPAIPKVALARARLERKLAALQVIEALRQHAAQTGELPEKLADVKTVPVPDDPGAGKPFEYQRDGATATLVSRLGGAPPEGTNLRYRLTLRK
ncbi:MAG: hypothetical protein ACJ8F7_21165 [Gemmataceae bacterium]